MRISGWWREGVPWRRCQSAIPIPIAIAIAIATTGAIAKATATIAIAVTAWTVGARAVAKRPAGPTAL